MGIYDRDYYRQGPRTYRLPDWSITNWLIGINVAIFILDVMSNYLLRAWGYFSIDTAIRGLQVWRLVTMQFLHHDPRHIFFNMVALFFFGPIVEQMLGARRYLAFYLICGIASALLFTALCFFNVLGDDPRTPLIGASGGIFGVLIAAAIIAPNAMVLVFFFPMRLRYLAIGLVAIAVITVLGAGHTPGQNAGGEAAHIGGALMGWLLIKNPRLLNFANYRRGPRMRYRP
jgi:membrane associated rhomboid family serine protease